jgi:DNA polymerase (family 10)
MDKHAIAIVLEEIGTLLEIHGENRFKARAFMGAARALEKLDENLQQVLREGRLETLPGIGPATAGVIRELFNTGTSLYYRDLRARTPDGLLDLLSVPQLGATRIRMLHDALGIRSLDELEQAARAGDIAGLKGFGPRTEQRILEGITYVRGTRGRRRYADALELGSRLRAFTESLPGARRAELAGELRRCCETVSAIELLVAVAADQADAARRTFLALPGLAGVTHEGGSTEARLADGMRLRLTLVPLEQFPTQWLFATGAEAHLSALMACAKHRGLMLTPTGCMVASGPLAVLEEEDIYAALGMPYVEPELRETGVEVEAARAGRLPTLVELNDLRGCFHNHTTYSDGKATISQMAEAALERGWRYLGISDHSQYAGYAGGLNADDIRRQHDEIAGWNNVNGKRLWLFHGLEADILPDGELDLADQPDVLASLDFVIGSAHSAFGLSARDQTTRFLRVLENPYLTFLGHLTGRLLLSRQGYELDLERIFNSAARRGVAIEINGDPRRMELDWRYWPHARELGILTAINPDAHGQRQLDFVEFGVAIARKGWLEPEQIINTWTLTRVKRFFQKVRRA